MPGAACPHARCKKVCGSREPLRGPVPRAREELLSSETPADQQQHGDRLTRDGQCGLTAPTQASEKSGASGSHG